MEIGLHLNMNSSVEMNFAAQLFHPTVVQNEPKKLTIRIRECDATALLNQGMHCYAEFPDKGKRKIRIQTIEKENDSLLLHCEYCNKRNLTNSPV